MYLVEMNKIELVSKGHGKKDIHINEIMFRFLILRNIINDKSVLESAKKCRKNGKDERKNIICEIFYVVSVHMPGEIL